MDNVNTGLIFLMEIFLESFLVIFSHVCPRYQDKCLTRIQTALKNLPEDVRPTVEKTLQDSGCLSYLKEA